MGLANRWLPYSVYLKTGSTTAWINQIKSTQLAGGVELFAETSGSETDTQFVAEKQIKPVASISSTDLTALSTVTQNGLFIVPASGKPGCQIFARQLGNGGLPVAIGTSAHIICAASDGLMVPKSIRAGHNTLATLSLELHAILGTTPTYSNATPFAYSNANAITSGQSATANLYAAGPVKFTISAGSSYLVSGVTQSGVDFGIQTLVEGSDSDVYPSHVSIIARAPRLEFSTKDATFMTTVGDGVSVSSFATYFRNIAQNSQRVAAATTSHASVIGTLGMLTPGSLGLTHKQPGESQFIYTPALDTVLLTVSVAAAIPTT